MINTANVGVGIRGDEGCEAARASDYIIGEFKFLKRLLLQNGREYRRKNVNLVGYNFYKYPFFLIILETGFYACRFFFTGFKTGFRETLYTISGFISFTIPFSQQCQLLFMQCWMSNTLGNSPFALPIYTNSNDCKMFSF